MTFLSPLIGQDLYEVGKALEDLGDLDQNGQSVHKVGEQQSIDERKEEQRKKSVWVTEGQM